MKCNIRGKSLNCPFVTRSNSWSQHASNVKDKLVPKKLDSHNMYYQVTKTAVLTFTRAFQ